MAHLRYTKLVDPLYLYLQIEMSVWNLQRFVEVMETVRIWTGRIYAIVLQGTQEGFLLRANVGFICTVCNPT